MDGDGCPVRDLVGMGEFEGIMAGRCSPLSETSKDVYVYVYVDRLGVRVA